MNETTEEIDKITKERDQWKDCADRLVASSGWHDQWPQAVAHYRKMITKKMLDESIGSEGSLVNLAEAGCFGKAYYNIHTK